MRSVNTTIVQMFLLIFFLNNKTTQLEWFYYITVMVLVLGPITKNIHKKFKNKILKSLDKTIRI